MPAMMRKTYYGVTLGILMVESYFRRFPGDIGNAETWPFPVQYKIVRGAVPEKMVALGDGSLLAPFTRAAEELIAEGVDGITTTCGFLALYQPALARALSVPVATSALLQAPAAARILPQGKGVGILTYDAAALTTAHLAAVGVDPSTPVAGLPPGSEFRRAIREGDPSVPYEEWEAEVLDAAGQLLAAHPETGAIVCECTNLTPFSAAIAERYGVAVFDAVTLVHWFYHGLRPHRFPRG
jgi:hypothetical protein